MKPHLLASTLLFCATSVMAADYFVVVPVKGRTAAAPAETISVELNPYTLPGALEGSAYSFDLKPLLTVTGDNAYTGAGVTWSLVSSSLPAGLYLTADGFIGGTPTASGSGAITVRASYKTKSGEQTYQVVSAALTVTLASATLPAGTVGTAYSYDFKPLASSNDPAFSSAQAIFSASGLPAGLSVAANGVLSGTPTVKNEAGASFQVVANYKTKAGEQAYTIVVNGVALQVKQVSAGGFHTCAVTISGGLKCWGYDAQGQLGNDAGFTNQALPVDVQGLTSGVTSVAAGLHHTCAVTTSGGLKCWGRDHVGQLGNDSSLANQPTPVDVQGLTSGVASVAAGGAHTCAATTVRGVKCWGNDAHGQLGNDAALAQQPTPVDVQGLTSGIASVSAGGGHTCAVTTSGGLKCWGYDGTGQLGNDTALTSQPTPVNVLGLASGVTSVSTGTNHTCAVTTSGGLKCWGYNNAGQLGNNSTTNSPVPGDVQGLSSGVASVAAGSSHTCAVTASGGLKCWGDDGNGQLGDDVALTSKLTPLNVAGVSSGVASVSVGSSHTCAVTTSGGAKCWGADDYGQLGNDAALKIQPTPVDVAP